VNPTADRRRTAEDSSAFIEMHAMAAGVGRRFRFDNEQNGPSEGFRRRSLPAKNDDEGVDDVEVGQTTETALEGDTRASLFAAFVRAGDQEAEGLRNP